MNSIPQRAFALMSPVEADRRTEPSGFKTLARQVERLAGICRTTALALRTLRGQGSDYDRRIRSLCECDPSDLNDAGQMARRQALRELRERERRRSAAAKRH